MIKTLNNLKQKKGFTLVELIVVLIILAILAALLIPALTGYIDKANEKKVIAETRMVAMAIQTVAGDAYAQKGGSLAVGDNIMSAAAAPASDALKRYNEVVKLSEINATCSFTATIDTQGAIKSVSYNDGTYLCVYNGTEFTVSKSADALNRVVSVVA